MGVLWRDRVYGTFARGGVAFIGGCIDGGMDREIKYGTGVSSTGKYRYQGLW